MTFAKSSGNKLYMFWGVFLQGFQWGGSHDVLCNSWNQGVFTWTKNFQIFCLQQFQLQCIWNCCSPCIFNLVPCHLHLLLQVSLSILTCAIWLVFHSCCTFLVPNSPALLRLRNHCFTFMLFKSCNCFVDHAMLTCYLHLSLRLGPKPLQCK